MIRKQLSVFLANRPGTLSRVGEAFKEGGVNILGLSVSDTVDHAVVRLIVDDSDKALSILEDRHLLVVESELLEVILPHEPGAFATFAERLAKEDINIDYAYGSHAPSGAGQGVLYVHVSNLEKGKQVVEAYLKELTK